MPPLTTPQPNRSPPEPDPQVCYALHIGVDAATGQIVAATPTDRDGDDAGEAGRLLDQIPDAIASFTGDGAYDRSAVYATVLDRHPEAAVVVPPRADAVPSDTAATAPTQRDRHLQTIAERGRMGWQRTSGYNQRARVEGQVGRFKQVIGDRLRFHHADTRANEIAIAVAVLNRMLELGQPKSVFTA